MASVGKGEQRTKTVRRAVERVLGLGVGQHSVRRRRQTPEAVQRQCARRQPHHGDLGGRRSGDRKPRQPAVGAALSLRLPGGAGAQRDRRPPAGPSAPHRHREYLRVRRRAPVHRILRRHSPLLRDGGHAAPAVRARRMVAGDAGRRAPRAAAGRRPRPASAAHLFSVHPRAAPTWYFAANAATTFVLAFLVPFFFFRSNVRAEASLQRIGQWKLKRVIDADLIGVVRGRLSGRIEDANDTFLSLLGYTPSGSRRRRPRSRHDCAVGLAPGRPAAAGPHLRVRAHLPAKDGTTVPALVGIARLDESDDSGDSHDEVVGFVLDLTAQKHLEAQRTMLHDSREALRLRDLFNSIASHELKTPLTALLLNLRLLSVRLDKETPPTSPLRAQVVALRVGGRANGRAHSRAAGRRADSSRPAHPRHARNERGGRGPQRGERIRGHSQRERTRSTRSRCAPRSPSPPSSTRCGSIRSSPTCSRTPSSTAPANRSRCASATIAPPTRLTSR